jgi:hypothetical protein
MSNSLITRIFIEVKSMELYYLLYALFVIFYIANDYDKYHNRIKHPIIKRKEVRKEPISVPVMSMNSIPMDKHILDRIHPPKTINVTELLRKERIRQYISRNQVRSLMDLKDDTKKPYQKGVEYLYYIVIDELLEKNKNEIFLSSYNHPYLMNINTAKELAKALREDLFIVKSLLISNIWGVERMLFIWKNPMVTYERVDEYDDDE